MGVIWSYFFEQPWRDVITDNQNNQNFLKSYKPRNQRLKHLRILLHGPVFAGKSSFINSVESALRGRIADPAQTDANSGTSFTKKYAAHKIPKDDGSCYGFIFNDIMGLEEKTNKGVKVEDLELALKGHVSDGYQFNPEVQLKANDKHYNSCPSLEDRVHVLVSVIPADTVSLLSDGVVKKMREVRMTASEMRIPQLAILTKVDKLEPNMGKVYKNKGLKEQVNKFSLLLGLPIKCIFLVKNYHEEIKTNDDMTAQILSAVKQMICFGEDFVNKQSTSCT